MRIFSISYGIKTETEIEKWLRFLRKIKNEYDWHHPIETVWFVKSEKSAEEIFHDLYEPGTFEGFIVSEIKTAQRIPIMIYFFSFINSNILPNLITVFL